MHKIISLHIAVGVVAFFLLFASQNAFAAELILKVVPNTVVGDNATIIEARIDPQSKNLNVIEGVIDFQGEASDNLSVQIENGHSILPLWPVPPEYIESEKVVRFTGGIPNGFNNEGLLFRMRLISSLSSNLVISYVSGTAYQNDGLGTAESISSKPITISLDKSEKSKMIETSPSFKQFKSVIIILLIIVAVFIIFRYGYKKIIKK